MLSCAWAAVAAMPANANAITMCVARIGFLPGRLALQLGWCRSMTSPQRHPGPWDFTPPAALRLVGSHGAAGYRERHTFEDQDDAVVEYLDVVDDEHSRGFVARLGALRPSRVLGNV